MIDINILLYGLFYVSLRTYNIINEFDNVAFFKLENSPVEFFSFLILVF